MDATFGRNVGMFFMRTHEEVRAYHCGSCLGWSFTRFTALNLTLGWWGMISFVMTLYFQLQNFWSLIGGGGALLWRAQLARADRAALERSREQTDAATELGRFAHTIRRRLARGEPAEAIAHDMVDAAHVPLAKAEAYVARLAVEQAGSRGAITPSRREGA